VARCVLNGTPQNRSGQPKQAYKGVSGLIFARRSTRDPASSGGWRPAKLKKAAAAKDTHYYDEVTVDPRYEDLAPPPEQRKTL